jgi:branched-chain amino acid transport system substrate-binding protein
VLQLAVLAGPLCAQSPRPAPVLDARAREPQYLGPGRDAPPPGGLTEVRLAYFGPGDEHHPEWGDAWRGATLAIDEANAAGGYRGVPFRLECAWSESPWGSGVADLAKLVYERGAWAILGGVDGVTTHLAEQIVVKARLAQVSFGNTDASVHLTNVPWVFSLAPTDDAVAALLAEAVLERLDAQGRWVAVTATDHDSHTTWREINRVLSRRKARAPTLHVQLPSETPDVSLGVGDVTRSGAPVVLIVARARDAGRVVRALRDSGFQGSIVGGATLGRRCFVEEAGQAAEGVLFPLLFDVERAPHAFVATYRQRFGVEADWLAAHAYDAAGLTVAAIRTAGLNRVRIQDELRAIVPWGGVTGRVVWDRTGRGTREIQLGTIRSGQVVPLGMRPGASLPGRARVLVDLPPGRLRNAGQLSRREAR